MASIKNHQNLFFMRKNKNAKKVVANTPKRVPKEGYLAKTRFKIGDPSKGGNSEGVLVIFKTDGSKPDRIFSKDCKNLMQPKHLWSFEKYGLPYLKDIFKNGGNDLVKINLSKASQISIYHSVRTPNQKPIEILFDRRDTIKPKTENTDCKFILLAPKRRDLRQYPNDKFFMFRSQDIYDQDDTLNIHQSLQTIADKFLKWENKNDPKATGRMIVYETATRKPFAELSYTGAFHRL